MRALWYGKSLWPKLPPPVRSALGGVLSAVPPRVLLGKRFRKNLEFVKAAQGWPWERTIAYQRDQLRSICAIAARTPFYREVFRRAGMEPGDLRKPEDVAGLPLIDRDTVREHAREMCAVDPSSAMVERVSTGGTSGVPLSFLIGVDRSLIEYAYLVSGWERAGYRLGMPMAVLRGRTVAKGANGLRHEYDPLFRHHYYSSFHMTDEDMRGYLAHMWRLGPFFLHVYPSSVAALARFVQRSGEQPPENLRGILAESEIVYPGQRTFVREVFGSPYFSSYGHTEKLVAAAGCEHSTNYHVWGTYGYLELLDENDKPVRSPGQRGEIVGTGFINRVMPFLRYRTGDFATYVADRCEACGREQMLLADIRGHRTQEMLLTHEGTEIPWTALNMHDDTFAHVRRFRFLQETRGKATLQVVPATEFCDDDARLILKRLERKIEGQLDITLERVDSIPLSPQGKAVYVEQRIDESQLPNLDGRRGFGD